MMYFRGDKAERKGQGNGDMDSDFIWHCGRDYGMAANQQYRPHDSVK